MTFSPEVQATIDDLKSRYYNGDAYNASTNPGGMGEGGHRQNFEPALAAVGVAGEAIGIAIDDIDAPDLRVRSNEFRAAFLGSLVADPTTDGNGNNVVAGQWYWNSTSNEVRIFNGTNWNVPVSNAADYVPEAGGIFSGAVAIEGDVTLGASASNSLMVNANVATDFVPDVAETLDLGTTGKRWQTLYTAAADLSGGLAVAGASNLSGTVSLGDTTADSLSLTGGVGSHIVPVTNDTVDLGAPATRWRQTYVKDVDVSGALTVGASASVNIDNGTIDGTVIGAATPATGAFTTLSAAGVTGLTDLSVTGECLTSLVPDASTGKSLGSATTQWEELHLSGNAQIGGAVNAVGPITAPTFIAATGNNTVIDAPSGQTVEIHIDGAKKAEITEDGDIIAERNLRAGLVEMVVLFMTSQPAVGDVFTVADYSVFSSSGSLFNSGASSSADGTISFPGTGVFDIFLAFSDHSDAEGRIAIERSLNGGSTWSDLVLVRAPQSGGDAESKGIFFAPLSIANSSTKLRLRRENGSVSLGEGRALFSVVRRA